MQPFLPRTTRPDTEKTSRHRPIKMSCNASNWPLKRVFLVFWLIRSSFCGIILSVIRGLWHEGITIYMEVVA